MARNFHTAFTRVKMEFLCSLLFIVEIGKRICYEEYRLKRQILIRGICDFISGMTDTYAMNEYSRIIQPIKK